MPLQQWRISTIVAAMLITLALLLGGQHLYNKYLVNDSLDRQIARVAAVEELRVARDEKPPAVYIHIPHVQDLQTDYRELTEIIRKRLGSDYRVVLLDNRTSELQSLYEQCSFAIQEAITTGNFQAMQKEVSRLAAASNVQNSLSVDSYNVYLELRDERDSSSYLYEVIPRLSQLALGGQATSQGGAGN
jgi:hypothetical protein